MKTVTCYSAAAETLSRIIAVVVLSLSAWVAQAAIPITPINYYVDPSGSDSGDGSKDAPFKTLARAAKAATSPGTTVFVAPGTYEGGVKTTADGTVNARIYWVSTTQWGAKIVPPANSTNDTAWDNRGDYVNIVGFEVDGSNARNGTKWTHGIYTGGSYGVIEGNKVHHTATNVPCTSAGGSAIGVDSYYKGVMTDVIGNTVHNIGPAGCKFVQGIYMSTSGSIKDNVVYGVSEAAIHLWHDAHDVQIINNTVSSSDVGIIVGGGDFYFTSAGANNVTVSNNTVYGNTYGISEQGKTGSSNLYENNLVFENAKDWDLKTGRKTAGPVVVDRHNPGKLDNPRAVPTPSTDNHASVPVAGGITPSTIPKGAISDATEEGDFGCTVLLCLSNPAGPMAEAECVSPITKLYRNLAAGRSFPNCNMANGTDAMLVKTAYRSWAAGTHDAKHGTHAVRTATEYQPQSADTEEATLGEEVCEGAPSADDPT